MKNNIEFLPSVSGNISDIIENNKENNWASVPAQSKVFVHRHVDEDFSAACRSVGVTRAEGARMLRDPLINAYMEHVEKDRVEASLFSAQFVQLEMLKTLEQVDGAVEVPNVTKEGDVVMAPRFNATAKIQLLRDMQKMTGLDKEKGVDGHGVTVQINLGAAGYNEEHDHTIGVTIENGSDHPTQ